MTEYKTRSRKYIGLSIILHLALLTLILIKLPKTETTLPAKPTVKTIQAVAINTTEVNAEIEKLKQQETQKKEQQQRELKNFQDQISSLQKKQQREEQHLVQLKAHRQVILKKQHEMQEREKKVYEAEILKLRQTRDKQLKLIEEQNHLQQDLTQQELSKEGQNLSAEREQEIKGIIDQYKVAIIQAVQQQWIVPDSIDKKLFCILLVHLGPGGVVLSVDLIQSSGDAVLDRSARTAVFKASPLPVPNDPEIFERFRELRLTVKPLKVQEDVIELGH